MPPPTDLQPVCPEASQLLSDGIQDTEGVTDTRMSLIPADLARHVDVKVSSFASFSQ